MILLILLIDYFLRPLLAYESKSLILNLINRNSELFRNEPQKYYEKETFTQNLKKETILNFIYQTYFNQENYVLNEIEANRLNSFLKNENFIFDLNEPRVYKQLNKIWYIYCSDNLIKCKRLCLKKEVLNSYKKHWCLDKGAKTRLKREISYKNLTKEDLLEEIMDELNNQNLKNNFVYLKSLADSLNRAKIQNSINQNFVLDKEVNECQKSPCDANAICINTIGSFRCKCKPNYVGHGRPGGCFNGKFCSGRYCRLNGECLYKDSVNGYKCKCSLQCQNGGKCVMTKFKYECSCPRNVTGVLCNETVEYNLFRQKIDEKFQDMTTQDSIMLSDLIKFVEPDRNLDPLFKYYNVTNAQIKKFELLNFIKNNINKFDKTQNEHESLFSDHKVKDILFNLKKPYFDQHFLSHHHHHNFIIHK